jgi:hypothetical protein
MEARVLFLLVNRLEPIPFLEHLLRVRCIAYEIVHDTAYNEVRKALFVES